MFRLPWITFGSYVIWKWYHDKNDQRPSSFFLFLLVLRFEQHSNYYFKDNQRLNIFKDPAQKVVGHHLYHTTVSQVQPQLMANRVFLLKPRDKSDYQFKFSSVSQRIHSFSVVDAFSSLQELDNVVSSRCQSGEKAYLSCAPPLKASHTAHTEEKQIPHWVAKNAAKKVCNVFLQL